MDSVVADRAKCPRTLWFRLWRGAAAALVFVVVSLAASRAQAYPFWQLSTGNVHCSQCHYAPSGGGLINSFGRDAAGDELSTFGGDGAFLHGVAPLPSWLALGGDLRGAFAHRDVRDPDGPTQAFFPMQADLYLRLMFGAGISLSATGGFRGQIRGENELVPPQNWQPVDGSRAISREHYVMWRPASVGPYARVGRFFAPFGLRPAEHFMYIRRDLGLNTLQETYNASGGFIFPSSELHVTVFVRDYLRNIGGNENGVAAYYEHSLRDIATLAGQVKYGVLPDARRLVAGGVGKVWVEPLRTQFFVEGDFVNMMLDGGIGSRQQFVGAGGFSMLPVRGLVVTLLGERFQNDLAVSQAAWNAASGLLSWFPYAHVEAQVMLRADLPGGGDAATTFFAQLHYYL